MKKNSYRNCNWEGELDIFWGKQLHN